MIYQRFLTLFSQEAKAPDLRAEFNISKKALSLVRGFYIATHPESLTDFQSQNPKSRIGKRHPEERPLRFLVDECVPPEVTYYISRYLGWATHVNFEQKNGDKDPEIYQYAKEHGFDVIVSRDWAREKTTDWSASSVNLTDIANFYALSAYEIERYDRRLDLDPRYKDPMILHIGGRQDWDNIRQRIKANAQVITDAIEARNSPTMFLTARKLKDGLSYEDIFHAKYKPADEVIGAKKERKAARDPEKFYIDREFKKYENKLGRRAGAAEKRRIRRQLRGLYRAQKEPYEFAA